MSVSQPSSAISVTLPPMASEATSNGDTVGKPTTAATALRMGKPTKPIYDPIAHESFCRLGIIAPYLQAFTSLTTLSLSGAAADRRALEAFSIASSPSFSGDALNAGVPSAHHHPETHFLVLATALSWQAGHDDHTAATGGQVKVYQWTRGGLNAFTHG